MLAKKFTVIAPDNRGAGDSTIPANNLYTSEAMAADLKGLLDFLNINETLVFGHDKGAGPTAALAAQHRNLVKGVGFAEYALPGFGYEQLWNPAPNWDLYQNWQLAFWSVPDAAEYFIRGREKDTLSWYFFHSWYQGPESMPRDILDRYANSISKPGFLRAMLEPFSIAAVTADNAFFNKTLRGMPIDVPVIAMGGEASLAPKALTEQLWKPVARDLTAVIVPKSGHLIGGCIRYLCMIEADALLV